MSTSSTMLTTSKRILIFSLAYYPVVGGAEIAVKEITDRINDLEFDIVTLRFNKEHPKVEKIGNCTIYRINCGPGYLGKIFFVPQAALWTLKMAKEGRYSGYWSIMTYMLFPVVLARLFGDRTPYILTLQDGDPFEHVFTRFRIFPFLPLLLYGFRRAGKVQVISNFLADWARQMGYRGNVVVIPNGVEISRFENLSSKEKQSATTLITTSRLVKKNGIKDIINALKFLPDNFNLKILGTGVLESELKALTKELNLEQRVEFLGNVSQSDLPKHLHDADIFIRPSLSEGQGISFIEAMAAGLPVIATPVGGIPDFLTDRETGLFCEVNNPRSIADRVMEYINNSELKNKIIENARKMVEEKYDWNLIAGEMKSKVFNNL